MSRGGHRVDERRPGGAVELGHAHNRQTFRFTAQAVSLGLAAAALALVLIDSRRADASPLRVYGVERWAVKTLTDSDAGLVDFRARRTTVAALRRLRAPTSHARRLRGVETTVYRVRVRLLAVKLEDDQDIHLVIADPATPGTMIAESPAPGCTQGAAPAARRMMARARASIIRPAAPPSHFFKIISGLATVTGVGFFDFWHGQRGVAPNAIELHPVLGFH